MYSVQVPHVQCTGTTCTVYRYHMYSVHEFAVLDGAKRFSCHWHFYLGPGGRKWYRKKYTSQALNR